MRSSVFGVMLLFAGCAPDHIARSTCHSQMLATGDPWYCTVSGQKIDQRSSLSFNTESRNQVAQVKLALQVATGTLRVGYRDLTGDQHLSVTPDEPVALALQTRMHRDRRSFSLFFEPVGGPVEGLSGTVDYSTP